MREHKHLRKIRILLDVMYTWKQVGPSTSSDEIDDFQIALQKVENIKELCQEGVDFHIDSSILKRFNLYYHKYNTKRQWTTAN